MPLYSVEAINLRSRNFGEADKVITLFSKEKGKIQAIAKGSRRPTSKFGGRLEVFCHGQYLLATGRSLDIISQCETIDSFRRIREDKDKLNAGFYMVRLVDIITEERQVNAGLFELLLASLNALESGLNLGSLPRIFEVKLCDIEGFLPSEDMLQRKYSRLPATVAALKRGLDGEISGIGEKDSGVVKKVFQEIISDHTGIDIRKMKVIP